MNKCKLIKSFDYVWPSHLRITEIHFFFFKKANLKTPEQLNSWVKFIYLEFSMLS